MNFAKDALVGLAVGDALGVPVEFYSRGVLLSKPVKNMRAYGTHNQPKGTWSDDSSLTFCLADSLASNGYDLVDIAQNIFDWFDKGLWTPHGRVFDIGRQTRNSIDEIAAILKNKQYGALSIRSNTNEYSNGNGALMRILPLAFETFDLSPAEKFKIIKEVTCLTHGHIRSVIASLIYILFAEYLLAGKNRTQAYLATKRAFKKYIPFLRNVPDEIQKFVRILDFDIAQFPKEEIKSDGYVVSSLEASLWCLLNSNNYTEAVLTAVNLGEDTDTTGAITGGLAGIEYGISNIPKEWKIQLVKIEKIEQLAERLFKQYYEVSSKK